MAKKWTAIRQRYFDGASLLEIVIIEAMMVAPFIMLLLKL